MDLEDDFAFDENFQGNNDTNFKSPVPKSATMTFVNFFCQTPTHNGVTQDETDDFERQSSNSPSRIQMPPKTPTSFSKRPLSRNTRSLSQSIADTAALATGHAFDTFSYWIETPSTPIGSGDKRKLTRAVTLTPQVAAKIEQKVSNFRSLILNLRKPKVTSLHLRNY